MDGLETEMKKITLSLIARWIFGMLFLIAGLGTILQGTYIAAFFLFLIVIVLIPPISQLIENGLNFSLSGALRLVLVICLLIGFAVASSHTPSNTSAVQSAIAVPVAQNSGNTTPISGSTTPKQIETTEVLPNLMKMR